MEESKNVTKIHFLKGDKILLYKELRKNGYQIEEAKEKSNIPVCLTYNHSSIEDIFKILNFYQKFREEKGFIVILEIFDERDNVNNYHYGGHHVVNVAEVEEYINYQKEYELILTQ